MIFDFEDVNGTPNASLILPIGLSFLSESLLTSPTFHFPINFLCADLKVIITSYEQFISNDRETLFVYQFPTNIFKCFVIRFH